MRVLHTADWHIGRMLYGRKRYDEFAGFLEWLLETIRTESIDILLVAGDVFDTTTPSNRAQELYYQFLSDVGQTSCRHVIVIGGNHDSSSFLDAPKQLLRALKVHVVGSATQTIEEEVILLKDKNEKPEAIICAVPYLRDRDIRKAELGETIEDKNQKLLSGIKEHYKQAADYAVQLRRIHHQEGVYIPIIGMGHLFASGGKAGEGVRDLYVGSLAHFPAEYFPEQLDYVALGHLHVPQTVGDKDSIRYSGSSIPMGFGEAGQEKKVFVIDWKNDQKGIAELRIPCFQELVRISGEWMTIQNSIQELIEQKSNAWLEIEYTGDEFITDLRGQLECAVEDSKLEIRRIINLPAYNQVMKKVVQTETLDDLNEFQVFDRCLTAYDIDGAEREELQELFADVIKSMNESDSREE